MCACVRGLLQLLKDQPSASKSFYRLLVMFTWILIRFVIELCVLLLTWNGIAALSEECVAKLVNSEKRAARLYCTDAAINLGLNFWH